MNQEEEALHEEENIRKTEARSSPARVDKLEGAA